MGKKLLLRLGIAGLILWAVLQGGYSLYQGSQHKIAQQHLQQAIEHTNAREFDEALQSLQALQNLRGISNEYKAMAKLLEKTIELLRQAPDDQDILDSMHDMISKSNILQQQLVEKAKQSARERYSRNLEQERDRLLQELQDLDNQDTSKMTRAQLRARERKRLEILQKLSKVLSRIEKQEKLANTPASAARLRKEQDLLKELKGLQNIQESLLPKSQIPAYRARKRAIIAELQKIQRSPERRGLPESQKKLSLLNQLSRLLTRSERTQSATQKQVLQKQIQQILSQLSDLTPQSSGNSTDNNATEAPVKTDIAANAAETEMKTDTVVDNSTSTQNADDAEKLSREQAELLALQEANRKLAQDNSSLRQGQLSAEQRLQIERIEPQAKRAFRSQDYAKAVDLYQQLENIDPKNPTYPSMQSLGQMRMNNIPQAQQILQKIQQQYPGEPMIPLLQAEMAIVTKSDIPTEPLYQQVVQQREMSLALYRLGNAALRRGEAPSALQFYGRAQKAADYDVLEDSIKVRLFHNQGEAFVFLNRIPEAKSSFQVALRRDPNYSPSYVSLGQILYKEQDYSNASLLLTRATSTDPGNLFAWTLLGNSFHRMGDYQRAKNAFVKALSIQPANATVLYNLGTEEIALKDYTAAITHLESAMSIKPSSKTNAQLGIALVRSRQNLPRARQIFTEILQSQPNDPTAQLGLIEIRDTEGDYTGALNMAQAVLDKTPDNPEILYKKASLLFKLKQFPQSVQTFQTLINIDNSPDNRLGLANALLSNNQDKDALAQYDALIADSKSPEYLEGRANALIKLGQLDDAKASLEEILASYPNYKSMSGVREKITRINRLAKTPES